MTGATSIMSSVTSADTLTGTTPSGGSSGANFFARRLLRCNSLTSFSSHRHSSGDESIGNNHKKVPPRRPRRNDLSRSSCHEKKQDECVAESMRMDALNGLQMPNVTSACNSTIRSATASSIPSSNSARTTTTTRPVFHRTQSCGDVAPKPLLFQRTSSCSSISCTPEVQSMAEDALNRQALPTERMNKSSPLQVMSQSLHGSSAGRVGNYSRTPNSGSSTRLTQSVHGHGQRVTTASTPRYSPNPAATTSPRSTTRTSTSNTAKTISPRNARLGSSDTRRRVRLGGRDRDRDRITPAPSRVSHKNGSTSLQSNMRPALRPERLSDAPTPSRQDLSHSLHSGRQDQYRYRYTVQNTSQTMDPMKQLAQLPHLSHTTTCRGTEINKHLSPTTSSFHDSSSPTPCPSSTRGVPLSSSNSAGTNADSTPLLIEISPGVTARLRGAKETYQAVENDFYRPAHCQVCQADVCCIMDASYLLCPKCRSVSPLEGATATVTETSSTGTDNNTKGGIGMGFTMDELSAWQTQILASRSSQGGTSGGAGDPNSPSMAGCAPRLVSMS